MNIYLIAAMDQNRAIGKDNTLPWHIPTDMQHFRHTTTGCFVLMGRKTFESMGRPLPNRTNLVLTRDPHWQADGATRVASIEDAEERSREANIWHPLWVIGGAQIYEQALPLAKKMVLTRLHHAIDGADAYFPTFSTTEWALDTVDSRLDAKTNIALDIETWIRRA